jgi:hypothetical protein
MALNPPNLPDPFTRKQLLDAFATEWDALMAVIDAAENDALISRTDAAGWNVRDHLANLAAWLQSVIVMIRDGQPQWTGLGVPRELYGTESYDPLNEAIRQRTINWSVEDVLAVLLIRHETLVGLISQMSDEDLLKPVDDFVNGEGNFAICYKIDGNGPYHYREHREWIEQILARDEEV